MFEALRNDMQLIVREWAGRQGQPMPESGARAGYHGARRRERAKVHIAVDTLSHLLALKVTAADGAIASRWLRSPQRRRGHRLQRGTGLRRPGLYRTNAAEAASEHGVRLEVV